jgi:hypothetical protein
VGHCLGGQNLTITKQIATSNETFSPLMHRSNSKTVGIYRRCNVESDEPNLRHNIPAAIFIAAAATSIPSGPIESGDLLQPLSSDICSIQNSMGSGATLNS